MYLLLIAITKLFQNDKASQIFKDIRYPYVQIEKGNH